MVFLLCLVQHLGPTLLPLKSLVICCPHQVHCKKYGLFNTPASPYRESQEESFDENNDLELDVSYASTLLGKSSDVDDSAQHSDSFISLENQKADIETGLSGESFPQLEKMSDTAHCMVNDYLYDVLQNSGDKPHTVDQETDDG